MTPEIKKALDLALKALENSVDLVREDAYNAEKLYGNYPSRQGKVAGLKVLADDHEKAITAIRQARSAPVQEPEWKQIAEDLRFHGLTLVKTATGYAVLKLGAVHAQATPPAAQRQWVGLTEQEAAECWSTSTVRTWQAIEAKLKEKNNGGPQLRESP
jgi:hypothetical protein